MSQKRPDRISGVDAHQTPAIGRDLSGALDALVERVAERVVERMTPVFENKAPSPPGATLLSKSELASELHVSTATVDRLVRAGRLPFARVGDARRFDVDAVRRALEERGGGAPTTSEPGVAVGDVRLLSGDRCKR
jgi:excisionase family DNA binding protein